MNAIRTSLNRAPQPPASEDQLEAMRRRAWLESGICTVKPDELGDDWLRQAVINFATKRWGRRNAGKVCGHDD